MASQQESNSLSLKRKLAEDCLSKECKSRRMKAENGPSSDSSAKRCNCYCIRPNLAKDCVNFLKSGVPSRIMYYKQGSWHNFPEQIMRSLIEEFRGKRSSVVSVMDDHPCLVDFLSMTLVNLKSRKQRSVAWFDDTGKCFSPSLFLDEDSDDIVKVDAGNVEGTSRGIMQDKVANSPPEVVKQVVLESTLSVPQKHSNADILCKKITSVERGSEDFLFVQDLFLSGMGPFAAPNNLLRVYRYSPNDITTQCRLKAFERQIRSTKEERGDANVRYGWLGSRKNDIVRILINGLGTAGKPAEKSDLSAGVYLSPEDRTFTSVGLCDVDEKGVQYILLCRVILGNMEAVEPGSQEYFPTSETYDSGVDDCLNPKCYVMWPSHLSTHMRLEYLVSFKLAPKVRNYLLRLKGVWFHPSRKEVAMDISTLKPVMGETSEAPTTPWVSFKVLFGEIEDKISSIARELLFHHYEEMIENKITREEMVKKMRIIVGDRILLETLKKLHYCPSLWHKSSVEGVSSDPASTEAEQLSLDETGRNCVLSGNHSDSHAPNAMAEHSAGPSTKGCGTLATDMMVPKGHECLPPSGAPETSNSVSAKCSDSQGVEPGGRDCPMQIEPSGNSVIRFVRYQDPIVTRMPPIVRDGLLKTTSGRSASPGVEICNSVPPTTGPPGCGYLASIKAGRLAPDLFPSPKGYESFVPSLALGTSKTAGVKCLNSAPRRTPEGQGFLSLGIASQSPALHHSVKGQDTLMSAAKPPVYPLGRGSLPSIRSCTEAHDSLSLHIAPKGHDPPPPGAEPKRRESPTNPTVPESHRPKAMDAATKVHNAPTPITRETTDQAALNKLSALGHDAASGHAVGAAGALASLSTPRERSER